MTLRAIWVLKRLLRYDHHLVAHPGDWLCGEGDGHGGGSASSSATPSLNISSNRESRYRILGSVGKGIFSSVFRAVQASTETEVAIKVLRSNPVMYSLLLAILPD